MFLGSLSEPDAYGTARLFRVSVRRTHKAAHLTVLDPALYPSSRLICCLVYVLPNYLLNPTPLSCIFPRNFLLDHEVPPTGLIEKANAAVRIGMWRRWGKCNCKLVTHIDGAHLLKQTRPGVVKVEDPTKVIPGHIAPLSEAPVYYLHRHLAEILGIEFINPHVPPALETCSWFPEFTSNLFNMEWVLLGDGFVPTTSSHRRASFLEDHRVRYCSEKVITMAVP